MQGFKNVFKLNFFTELEGKSLGSYWNKFFSHALLGRRGIHMDVHVYNFRQRCQITADLVSMQAAVIKCSLKSVVERKRSTQRVKARR